MPYDILASILHFIPGVLFRVGVTIALAEPCSKKDEHMYLYIA